MIKPVESNTGSSTAPTEYLIPSGYTWDDSWELALDLIVEVKASKQETVALTRLSVGEYGLGNTFEEAIYDLLTSLSGYLEALEGRKGKLAKSAASELDVLRSLVRRKDTT